MPSWLCEYKALVNAYKCDITEKSHFLVVNGYNLSLSEFYPYGIFIEMAGALLPFKETCKMGII